MGNIFLLYLEWQFRDRPRSILRGWGNCLKFNLNYWSVPVLIKTLFSPWRRYHSSYGKGFSISRYFEAFSFNVISRVLGAILRIFLIVAGIFTEIIVTAVGLVVFLFWLLLPVLLILGLIYGFKLII